MNKICKKCGRSKSTKNAATLTQYLNICCCNVSLEKADDEQFCEGCGKRIPSEKKGSITQFIFQSHLCSCSRPVATPESQFTPIVSPAFQADSEELEDDGLDLSAEQFPLERYKPLRKLGQGGSSKVYLAFDKLLRKRVAVKILHILRSEMLIAFQEEARATSKLVHPNVVCILDFGVTAYDIPYMVLEYFESQSLYEILEKQGRLQPEECWIVFSQVCKGLCYTHDQGVYHRDLKPANILINGLGSDDVQVKIIDFGVAKVFELTDGGVEGQGDTIAGSPGYMAPDQVIGNQFDQRSEIYSLGCLLFEALTGRKPYEAESTLALMSMHVHSTVPRLMDVNHREIGPVQQVIDRCLAKDMNNRYQTMLELFDVIDNLRNEDCELSELNFDSKRKHRKVLRRWTVVLMIVMLAIFVAIFATNYGYEFSANRNSSKQADLPDSAILKKSVSRELKIQSLESVGEDLLERRLLPVGSGPNHYYASGDWSDADYKSLQAVKDIQGLSLTGKQISDTALKHLVSLPLIGIDLSKTSIKDEGVKHLAEMKTLKRIRLDDTDITDVAVDTLSSLPNLTYINLKGTRVTNKACGALSKIRTLDVIDLRNVKGINGESLEKLKNQPVINWLVLNGTDLTAKGVAQLGTLDNVRKLSLAYCGLNDEKVCSLKNLKVSTLDLSGNAISDRSLICIAGITSLNCLVIADCPGITDSGLKEFVDRRKHSSCRIIKRLGPDVKALYKDKVLDLMSL